MTSKQIEIDGETYTLNETPQKDSAVVLKQKSTLLEVIDLKTLVDDLGRIGGFVRIAYNAVGAAGPKFTEQQIQIQSLSYRVTKLCDESALTVAEFKRASSCVITDLQSTYDYLLDNMEKMALITLANVSTLAGDMSKAALDLKKMFEEEEKEVFKALSDIKTREGEEAIRIQELKQQQKEMEEQKQSAFILMKEHQQKEIEAESRRRDLEYKEDQALAEIGDIDFFKEFINAFTSVFGFKGFSDQKDKEKKVEAYRQARQEALQIEQDLRKQRHEALDRMTAFASKIKQYQEEENMAGYAVQALHEAAGVLRQLMAVMMHAALFWEAMQKHCKSLAEDKIKSQVEEAIAYSEEERRKVWTSKSFKRQAVQFLARWICLHEVCSEYMQQLKLTQRDLYRYITENPTRDESRSNLKKLVDTFLVDLQRDQKAINDKSFEAQKEIDSLKEGTPKPTSIQDSQEATTPDETTASAQKKRPTEEDEQLKSHAASATQDPIEYICEQCTKVYRALPYFSEEKLLCQTCYMDQTK